MMLLVDGYNMIGAWPMFSGSINLEHSRQALIDLLCDYAAYEGCELILVFDGYKGKATRRTEQDIAGIRVVYTKALETADAYIERFVDEKLQNLPRGMHADLMVATSDSLEQSVILSRGAVRLSAPELYRMVTQSRQNRREAVRKVQKLKQSSFEARLSEEVRAYLEKIRRGEIK